MIANLLDSLELPTGARIAVQVEKSVEALLLYLAVLRAGYVYLPLNTAYQSAEIEYFIGNAEPAVVVCSRPRTSAGSAQIAFEAGTRARLHARRRPHRHAARARRAVQRRSTRRRSERPTTWPPSSTPAAPPGAARARCSRTATCCRTPQVLKDYWGWKPGDVLIHALPIFHVHGLFVASHGALLNGSKMIWLGEVRPASAWSRSLPEATVFMGVPTLYVRLLAEPALTREAVPQHAPLHLRLGAAADRDLQRVARAHRPHHPRALRHERDRRC